MDNHRTRPPVDYLRPVPPVDVAGGEQQPADDARERAAALRERAAALLGVVAQDLLLALVLEHRAAGPAGP